MEKTKPKVCKMPKCQKETYSKRSLFCGEHERQFKHFLANTGKMAVIPLVAAAKFVLENQTENKNNKS